MTKRMAAMVTALALCAALIASALTPRRTYALSAGETVAVAVGAAVGYAALIALTTWAFLRTDRGPLTLQPQRLPPDWRREPAPPVRYGLRCPPSAGNLTLACW